jgi:hypothetical protein
MPFIIGLKVFINADDELTMVVRDLVEVSLIVCFVLLLHDIKAEVISSKESIFLIVI